jgi:P4 family phage/plasmid primase-like protien
MADPGLEFDRLHAAARAETRTIAAAAGFIGRLFSKVSEHPIYFSSLANEKDAPGEPGERHVITREVTEFEAFMRKSDRPGRATYFCVATVRPDSTRRAKDTVSEIVVLHADVDFKGIDLPPAEIEARVKQLQLLPSIVVSSGHGLHLYWRLRESIATTPESIEQVEALLRQLCDHVGGDRQCCEVARLMRLPGSHNSKFGARHAVTVMADRENCRYERDELEEWVSGAAPVIRRKGEAPADENPWLAVASRFGLKPPVDVEQRLAAMRYGAAGDASAHQTQISVTAALLNRGHPLEEVVATVLAATRVAAGEHGVRWNWRREEHAVRRMCADWLAKKPELSGRAEPAVESTGTDEVGSLSTKRAEGKQTQAKPAGPHAAPVAIADGVIAIVRKGGDLLLTGGDLHLYQDGVWRVAGGAEQQWLRCLIQQGSEALGEGARLGIVNAAWKRLVEHPGLYRETVSWDRRGLVAVANGVLDLQTRGFSDWKPEYFLRRKLGVAFDPARACPEFMNLVTTSFADLDSGERQSCIDLLQEFFGACVGAGILNREHRRALLLVGPSRTGKTELANIIRRLVGEPVASPAVSEIGERFGTATFYGATAWIRDDAVNEGDRIDPERFKTIVTGEPIDIERKNCPPLRQVRLEIPVVLTANSLPTSRDSSDAIFNRCLVVEMTNVFDEVAAVEARRQRGVPPGCSIGAWVFEREGPGILNWALTGLARLLTRGQYEIPERVRGAIQSFKDDSNPVAEWARTMLVRSDVTKIERNDLLAAFQGWWLEEAGEDARLKGGRWLIPKLRAACPWVIEIRGHRDRCFGGVRLNDVGLQFWQRQSSEAAQHGHGPRGTSSCSEFVNRPWNGEIDEGDAK